MRFLFSKVKIRRNWGPPLLSGFVCVFHHAVPGSNLKHSIYPFSIYSLLNYIYHRIEKKTKINKIRPGLTYIFQKFATEGLRTLLLGIRDLTEQEFNDWKPAHHHAAIALEDREAKLDEVYDTIERDLDILGATAIEDKLQVFF